MTTKIKSALIVGASRGLGLGLARELASRGVAVTATARDLDKATELRDLKGSVKTEKVDIDDAAGVDALAQRLAGQHFDVVFINAGVSGPSHHSADKATTEEIGKLFATNSVSPIRFARKFMGHVTPNTGTLAFMSSILGSIAENTSGGMELYRASKAALNSAVKGLSTTLDDKSLTVLAVHPGWVKTDMGGENATLDVATSTRGIVDQLEKFAGKGGMSFIDYEGKELPW